MSLIVGFVHFVFLRKWTQVCRQLVSWRPYHAKGPTADRGLPPFNPQAPPLPSVSLLFFSSFRASFTHFFLRGFSSFWVPAGSNLGTHGLFFLQLQMHRLSSTQNLGLRSVISQNNIPHRNLFFYVLSAYAQNPSSAPHSKVLQRHWAFDSQSPVYISSSLSFLPTCISHCISW